MRAVRAIVVVGEVAHVQLTKGYTALIDAADVWLVERWNWFAVVSAGGKVYAGRGASANGVKYTVLLHRHLLGAPRRHDVDHRDGDGLNCRRFNMRLCSPTQNNQNSSVQRNNKLGVKGVFHNGSSYVATIRAHGVTHHLGCFKTAGAASDAYAEAAKAAFGEFARVA